MDLVFAQKSRENKGVYAVFFRYCIQFFILLTANIILLYPTVLLASHIDAYPFDPAFSNYNKEISILSSTCKCMFSDGEFYVPIHHSKEVCKKRCCDELRANLWSYNEDEVECPEYTMEKKYPAAVKEFLSLRPIPIHNYVAPNAKLVEVKDTTYDVPEQYGLWFARMERVAQVAKTKKPLTPQDLLDLQLLLIGTGQFNANFKEEELCSLHYDSSPLAIMEDNHYLRCEETWGMRMLRQLYWLSKPKPSYYPLWVSTAAQPKEVFGLYKNQSWSKYNITKLMGLPSLVSTVEDHGMNHLLNLLGYRVELDRANHQLLSHYPKLFVDYNITKQFFSVWQLALQQQKNNESLQKYKERLGVIQKLALQHLLYAQQDTTKEVMECNFTEELQQLKEYYKQQQDQTKQPFVLYANLLIDYLTEIYPKHYPPQSPLALVINKDIKEALKEFLLAWQKCDWTNAVCMTQRIVDIMLVDLARPEHAPQKTIDDLIQSWAKSFTLEYEPAPKQKSKSLVQQVALVPYAMRAFAWALQLVKKQAGNKKLAIVVTAHEYFEFNSLLETLNPDLLTVETVHDLGEIKPEHEVIFTSLHPNNAIMTQQFSHNILALLKKIEQYNDKRQGIRTIVLDLTLSALNDAEIKKLLITAKPLIVQGKLNLILIQSLTKFAQLGLDRKSAGLLVVINNDQPWNNLNLEMSNLKRNEPIEQSTANWFIYLLNKPGGLALPYLQLIKANTQRLYRSMVGQLNALEVSTRDCLRVTANEGEGAISLSLSMGGLFAPTTQQWWKPLIDKETREKQQERWKALYEVLLEEIIRPLCLQLGLPLTQRTTIGLPLSSFNLIGNSDIIRFTVGLETNIEQYADILTHVAFIFNRLPKENLQRLLSFEAPLKNNNYLKNYLREQVTRYLANIPNTGISYQNLVLASPNNLGMFMQLSNGILQLKPFPNIHSFRGRADYVPFELDKLVAEDFEDIQQFLDYWLELNGFGEVGRLSETITQPPDFLSYKEPFSLMKCLGFITTTGWNGILLDKAGFMVYQAPQLYKADHITISCDGSVPYYWSQLPPGKRQLLTARFVDTLVCPGIDNVECNTKDDTINLALHNPGRLVAGYLYGPIKNHYYLALTSTSVQLLEQQTKKYHKVSYRIVPTDELQLLIQRDEHCLPLAHCLLDECEFWFLSPTTEELAALGVQVPNKPTQLLKEVRLADGQVLNYLLSPPDSLQCNLDGKQLILYPDSITKCGHSATLYTRVLAPNLILAHLDFIGEIAYGAAAQKRALVASQIRGATATYYGGQYLLFKLSDGILPDAIIKQLTSSVKSVAKLSSAEVRNKLQQQTLEQQKPEFQYRLQQLQQKYDEQNKLLLQLLPDEEAKQKYRDKLKLIVEQMFKQYEQAINIDWQLVPLNWEQLVLATMAELYRIQLHLHYDTSSRTPIYFNSLSPSLAQVHIQVTNGKYGQCRLGAVETNAIAQPGVNEFLWEHLMRTILVKINPELIEQSFLSSKIEVGNQSALFDNIWQEWQHKFGGGDWWYATSQDTRKNPEISGKMPVNASELHEQIKQQLLIKFVHDGKIKSRLDLLLSVMQTETYEKVNQLIANEDDSILLLLAMLLCGNLK